MRLHVGCGSTVVPGWVNLDKSPSVYLARVPGLRAALAKVRVLTPEQADADFPPGIVHADVRNGLSYPDASAAYVYSSHLIEHMARWQAQEFLRECRRVLAPGAPLVMVTPNVATLSVGAHTFWLDPSHRRPIPPELFRFYLEVEGFADVALETFEASETRLSEDLPQGAQLENARLLNEVLFGHRDYAVIGRQP